MLARPIHTLQPQSGDRFETHRLPHVRRLLRGCADKLAFTPLEMAVILDSNHDSDVERIELVQTCGKEMNIDEAKYRLDSNLLSKEDFIEMTPIAGTDAVFRPMSSKSTIYYNIGATADTDPISIVIERQAPDKVSINLRSSPNSHLIFMDNVHVDDTDLDLLFKTSSEGRVEIATAWPCTRGLRVNHNDNVLQMVLPPSLVSSLLDALVVASGVDAFFEVYRNCALPSRPWTADGDVTLKVEQPRVGTFNVVSLKIPIHPVSVHIPQGRMEVFLSMCGCAVKEYPTCLLCGRCTPWANDDDRRATFAGHCRRAGNRCLNRIRITVGKSTGGAWTDKRSCQLCIRDDPQVMALVEAVADVIQFANEANAMRFKTSDLVEHNAKLPPPTHVINDLPSTRMVTKLLRKKSHTLSYDKKKKMKKVIDRDGKPLNKTITKRYGWLFSKST